MSTTDAAVAKTKTDVRSFEERDIALGPGVLRTPSGGFLRPASTTLGIRCQGPLAHWKVINQYQVPAKEEGDEAWMFLFPLAPEASLLAVDVQGEQLMPSKLSVKSLNELPESVDRQMPSEELVEQLGSESLPILTLKLGAWAGALLEGGTFQVELEYASGLPTVDGRVCLSLPTRCSSEIDGENSTSFQFAVAIEDGNELVDEPTSEPPLQSAMDGDTLILSGMYPAVDENLLVTFRPGRTQMPVTRLRRSDEHFIFSIFPPTSIPASPQRRDLVFALDASENLDPEAFELVKADLCEVLQNLDENDRFALVTFGRKIDGYDGGEFCELDQVEAACKWLEASRPQGRADVQPLLQRIQSLPAQEDRQLCIFLLAAGHVGNEPSILKSLDFDQSDRRYYTVGIGQTAKQSFLRRLALLTRGRCEVSTGGGCLDPLQRLLGQTRALLAEVTFEEQEASDIDSDSLVPSKMTSLTPQGPVHCLGRGAPSSLRFRSKDETGVFFAGTVNAQPTDNPALSGVWAGLRVRELLDSIKLTTGAKRKALKAEASGLASQHGILTDDTVLVLETIAGVEIQYSAQPSNWITEKPKEKKGNVSNKDGAAPFDWRKGLVAREGLFKGSKLASSTDAGESSSRYGLRSKTGNSSETSGKPRLDRAVTATVQTTEEELPIEEEATDAASTDGQALEGDVAPTSVPVAIAANSNPVLRLQSDPLAEGRMRLDSFREQLHTYDTELAMAALAGLPSDLSPRGGDLPRILAQTVAHLEKRGFFSHAVSVLGLLLRDNPSPEVEKKMEMLLSAWAESLPDERLPEAIQIVKLGQRVCHGSQALEAQCQEYLAKWNEVSQSQTELPAIVAFGETGAGDVSALLSQPQVELAQLKDEQAELSTKLEALQAEVKEQFAALPNLLEKIAEQTAEAVAAKLPSLTQPRANASITTEQPSTGSPNIEIPLPTDSVVVEKEPAAIPEIPLPDPEPAVQEAAPETVEMAATATTVEGGGEEELADPKASEEAATATSAPVEEVPSAAESEEEVVAAQPETTPVEDEPEEALPPEPDVSEPEPSSSSVPDKPAEPEPVMVEEESEPEPEPEPEESLPLTKEELTELLLADPRSESSRKAVDVSLTEPKEKINFFRDLVKADKSEPYHSLSLARAYRAADQTKVAVVHYQKYLRSDKDPQAYLELAEAYDELGKANLSASARKAAEAYG